MNPEYHNLAQRTAPPATPELIDRLKHVVNLEALDRLLTNSVKVSELMDDWKKKIFYGKPNAPYVDEPSPSASAASARLRHDRHVKILHGIIGLISEAGELAESLHAWLFRGQELDLVNMMEETGDTRWYQEELVAGLDVTMDMVEDANIRKLAARYPNKFSEVSALVRDVDREREVLAAAHAGEQVHITTP